MHAKQDLYNAKKGVFDISKIPDVYDCAKYDAIHNRVGVQKTKKEIIFSFFFK